MGQALYRKYRSKKLSEIVGQEHITKTLDNALKTGKVSHAYLFTGPRGVGKTSIARILAHEVNNLPYTDESVHLDIIEIDAASNRRIDEIRDLRDKVHIAPTSAKYKVYIIDEVHMLTKEAFNALLKTLEEPPEHVIFILATTELHKLPETIVSRTQRFTFKPVELQKAVEHLRSLAKNEGVDIDDEALELLAKQGGGSFRDSISLLDQIRHHDKKITKQHAEQLIGIANSDMIQAIVGATLSGTPATIIESLEGLAVNGVNPGQAAKQIADEVRLRIVGGDRDNASLTLLSDLIKVSGGSGSIHELEVALFRANLEATGGTTIVQSPAQTNTSPAPSIKQAPRKVRATEIANNPTPKSEPVQRHDPEKQTSKNLNDLSWWQEVLTNVKAVNNTLYGILRMAEPSLIDEQLDLKFKFDFHRKKASDAPTMKKIQEIIQEVTGQLLSINPVHSANTSEKPMAKPVTSKEKVVQPSPNNADLDTITNIFGGGEVLES